MDWSVSSKEDSQKQRGRAFVLQAKVGVLDGVVQPDKNKITSELLQMINKLNLVCIEAYLLVEELVLLLRVLRMILKVLSLVSL